MSLRNDFIKIQAILIGNKGVGKHALLSHEEIKPGDVKSYTDIPDAHGKEVQVKFYCHDPKKFYQSGNEQLIFIVYDITDKESFLHAQYYHSHNNLSHTATHILIGNKTDVNNKRLISFKQGQELANELQIPFFEVSAESGVKASEAIRSGISHVCKQLQYSLFQEPQAKSAHINVDSKPSSGFFPKLCNGIVTIINSIKNWVVENFTLDNAASSATSKTPSPEITIFNIWSSLGTRPPQQDQVNNLSVIEQLLSIEEYNRKMQLQNERIRQEQQLIIDGANQRFQKKITRL